MLADASEYEFTNTDTSELSDDVTGDNQNGDGTTNTTWNLGE